MHDSENLKVAVAGLIEVVARLLIVELDAIALQALAGEEISALLEELEPGVSSTLVATTNDSALQEELDAEFCRLFLIGEATSPMASAWLDGEQLANAARLSTQVQHWQASLEVEMEQGPWGNVPPDHISILLGLFSLALVREESGKLAEEIYTTALASMVPDFVKAICAESTNPVYRAGVRLLPQLLQIIHPAAGPQSAPQDV